MFININTDTTEQPVHLTTEQLLQPNVPEEPKTLAFTVPTMHLEIKAAPCDSRGCDSVPSVEKKSCYYNSDSYTSQFC